VDIERCIKLKINHKIYVVLMLGLMGVVGSVNAEFRASDHDGFQRPKETKTEPNKSDDKGGSVKKENTLPSEEKNKLKEDLYEDMDGFKRPKKEQ
jgi:hypothetical protein